ncbi:MAG: type III restriction-modification system endonuclease [Nanoarchaeota archaeon]|nr:type III restriction-modification system endonuclease [Nanoarchaeota archaeon]
MSNFNFEKNLDHQTQAVKSTIGVFNSLDIKNSQNLYKDFTNPIFDTESNFTYVNNIGNIQEQNNIERNVKGKSNIIDIMMETGTGKTYTYTKTIFELNKIHGINKFIIVVPTLPIKAGTIDFLTSDSTKEHFKEQYGKTINLHIIESQKVRKNQKSYMPTAVTSFVNSGKFEKNKIQVLIINSGMINSKKMLESYDKSLLDKYSIPFEAISSTKPFMIIDEPHKFGDTGKSWKNITEHIKPQFILRYGATFKDNAYENLVYTLTAVDSFNRNLVKGVTAHITEFENGENILVKFNNSDGKEATLELNEDIKKKTFKLIKKDSLEKVHPAMSDLYIENLNKNTIILSNGLELKKGDKINPYSYSQTLQETMIKKTIKNHFQQEKKYLTREVKIKPLSLFFIDNIEEYRNENGSIRLIVEKYIKSEVENLLKTENNEFYKNYLKKTLEDIPKTHGGYFSEDNKNSEESIEKEVTEILHDKKSILNLNNPRRFIFSKWTLREGWDNPNIFQICKLRSSGSETSKLQEVGRGLRLPVNEFFNRVKEEQFYLNYFVDFTENDFVERLVNEINEKSGAISRENIPIKLDNNMIKQIIEKYNLTEDALLDQLDEKDIIKRNNDFKENGFDYIKSNFPLIFEGIDSNKIRKSSNLKKKVKIRAEKYSELKELWEKLNEKVILEYKIENESKFKELFIDFLNNNTFFSIEGVQEKIVKLEIENNSAQSHEEYNISENEITPISTMKYDDFLIQLSNILNINLKTIHQSFIDTKTEINKYLNQNTIRIFKQKFDNYLLYNAIEKFSIEYQKVTNSIHPTKITDGKGDVLTEIDSSNVGISYSEEKVAENYIFDELFYDSELEKENIQQNLTEVVVFTKIPKNSIKIPVAGGKTYSPDFAYVLNFKNGNKKLNLVVETKNTDDDSLREEEKRKIKHAEKLFNSEIEIKFETQYVKKKILNLIQEIYLK